MLNKCLLRKTKRQRLTSRASSRPQAPQSIKAALLSKSLGPKGNQTQQLELCFPRPVPPCPGFSRWGPSRLLWPRKECWRHDLTVNLTPASEHAQKPFSCLGNASTTRSSTPCPRGAHRTHASHTELHTCLVLLPAPRLGQSRRKRKEKFVLNIYDPGGILVHRAEFLHKEGKFNPV